MASAGVSWLVAIKAARTLQTGVSRGFMGLRVLLVWVPGPGERAAALERGARGEAVLGTAGGPIVAQP